MIENSEIIMLAIVTLAGFLGQLLQTKFKQIETINDRVTTIETKLQVMGDIRESLGEIKTDVAVIMHKLESKQEYMGNM